MEQEVGWMLHDTTRGFVGNSMVWWKKGHCGYTCDVRDAHIFSREEAMNHVRHSGDLVAYSVLDVLAEIQHHVTAKHKLTELTVPETGGKDA